MRGGQLDLFGAERVGGRRLVARKVFRTGVQSLWEWPDGSHSVSIKNRSYSSEHPLPSDKVETWKSLLS